METRYDPTFDLTDYSERFRAVCPVCGRPYRVLFSVSDVPSTAIDPAVLPAFQRLLGERFARAREHFLGNPRPCGLCAPPEGAGQTNHQLSDCL